MMRSTARWPWFALWPRHAPHAKPSPSAAVNCWGASRSAMPLSSLNRSRREVMNSRRSTIGILSALAVMASLPAARAEEDCRLMESKPQANAVIEGRSSEFFVRFDRPVDHIRSTLSILRDGQVIERLQPRLESAPSVLFARAPTLPEGSYQLHWTVHTMAGTDVTEGDIPFTVKD